MAFTSKVVILLTVSSLAWCQASAEGASANSIVNGLIRLAHTTSNAALALTLHTPANPIPVIDHITKAFVKANNNLTVSGPLSEMDRVDIFQAYTKLSTAQLKLFYVYMATYKGFSAKRLDRRGLRKALASLKEVAVDAYGHNVLKLIPNSLTGSGINLLKAVRGFIDFAVLKLHYG